MHITLGWFHRKSTWEVTSHPLYGCDAYSSWRVAVIISCDADTSATSREASQGRDPLFTIVGVETSRDWATGPDSQHCHVIDLGPLFGCCPRHRDQRPWGNWDHARDPWTPSTLQSPGPEVSARERRCPGQGGDAMRIQTHNTAHIPRFCPSHKCDSFLQTKTLWKSRGVHTGGYRPPRSSHSQPFLTSCPLNRKPPERPAVCGPPTPTQNILDQLPHDSSAKNSFRLFHLLWWAIHVRDPGKRPSALVPW